MKKIFFPGSFNPFTKGHADILNRLLELGSHVTIGIGVNVSKPEARVLADRNAARIMDYVFRSGLGERVDVRVYGGLTAETAIAIGADCIARGVRTCADFEYEYQLAALNRETFGIETILLPADPQLAAVSSTAVRDLQSHGRDDIAEKFLP